MEFLLFLTMMRFYAISNPKYLESYEISSLVINDMHNLDDIEVLFVGWLNCFGSNTEIGIYQDHEY